MCLAPREDQLVFDLQMRPEISPYLVPYEEGALIRGNRVGIGGEPRGRGSQLHDTVVQLSVFDPKTRHHCGDHRNFKIGGGAPQIVIRLAGSIASMFDGLNSQQSVFSKLGAMIVGACASGPSFVYTNTNGREMQEIFADNSEDTFAKGQSRRD